MLIVCVKHTKTGSNRMTLTVATSLVSCYILANILSWSTLLFVWRHTLAPGDFMTFASGNSQKGRTKKAQHTQLVQFMIQIRDQLELAEEVHHDFF